LYLTTTTTTTTNEAIVKHTHTNRSGTTAAKTAHTVENLVCAFSSVVPRSTMTTAAAATSSASSSPKEEGGEPPSRAALRRARRVCVKAGTSVVANENGRPSLTRLGAIAEQISELVNAGVEVIFVSSGAVGMVRRHTHIYML
jgi:hypothetical protein